MTNAKLWYVLIGVGAISYYLEREYESFAGFYLLPLRLIYNIVAKIDLAVSNSAFYTDLLINPDKWPNTVYLSLFIAFLVAMFILQNARADVRNKRRHYLVERLHELKKL